MIQAIADESWNLNGDEEVGSIFDQLLLFLEALLGDETFWMTDARREHVWVETNVELGVL